MIKHPFSKFSTNKSLVILALFTIALALTACGGGGGGGNPAGPLPDATEDAVLKANYPTVSSSYSDLRTILENNAADINTRMAGFMAEIADDFVDMSGTASRTELENVTKSRLERYTVNSYQLTPISHVEEVSAGATATDTLKVTTRVSLTVTRKPGAAGAVDSGTFPISPDPVVTWKLQPDNTWKIYQGLPYKQSEIGF